MRPELVRFLWCPLESRSIRNLDDAQSYYAHKLVGAHQVTVRAVAISVVFKAEEIHAFTANGIAATSGTIVARGGRSTEARLFSLERARRLDDILSTLANAATVRQAKTPSGRLVFGPAAADSWRYAVVIAPDRDEACWYVRTAYPVSAKSYTQALREGRPAPWPPK